MSIRKHDSSTTYSIHDLRRQAEIMADQHDRTSAFAAGRLAAQGIAPTPERVGMMVFDLQNAQRMLARRYNRHMGRTSRIYPRHNDRECARRIRQGLAR